MAVLCSDLRNGPRHVFINHANCNVSFCKVAAQVTEDVNNVPISEGPIVSSSTPSVQAIRSTRK